MKMNNLGIIKQIKLQRAITHSDIDEFKLDENYFYDTESQELYEIGLQRQIDVKGLDKIFLDAMDLSKIRKFWKIDEVTAVHLDGYIGIHLHNLLRLSTAEASRPELWNSIIFQISNVREYISFRINHGLQENKELGLSDIFLKNSDDVHNKNKLAGPWWAVELTRNGSDYSSAKNAFFATYFTDRYMTMNFMHYRQLAIGMANYFNSKSDARELLATKDQLGNPSFSNTINDYLISRNDFEIDFESISYDSNKFYKWQNANKKSNIINDGPDDFKVSDKELNKVYKLFDELIKQRK